MSGSVRGAVVAGLALLFPLLLVHGTPATAAPPTDQSAAAPREGRTTLTVSPETYTELTAAGVEITPVGRARVRPVEGTVEVRLPITARTSGAVEHAGGIRFASDDSHLVLRHLTIPDSGFVTADLRGSDVSPTDASSVFLQSDSSSPLGDTMLKFTWTFASKLNHSFGTGFRELGVFGYATVPQ